MKIKIMILALMSAFAAGQLSAASGNCLKNAKTLKGSQSVSLVNEKDEDYEKGDDSKYLDTGAMYYTLTLKRGTACTIWITGGSVEGIDLDVDTNWNYYEDRENEPGASFDIVDYGSTKAAFLYADDWDSEEDPSTGRYVVYLSGDIGASTMLYYTTGIRTFSKTGDADTPRAISFGTSWKSYYGSLLDGDESSGEYNFRASLKAGTMYRVRTLLGTKTAPLSLGVDALSESVDYDQDQDTSYVSNLYDESWVIVPETSGKFTFTVEGDEGQKFRLYYKAVSARAVGSHPSVPLLEENGYAAHFVPGRMSSSYNYYDSIVDEGLCKIYLEKGEQWVFETQGASVNQRMYAYSTAGKVLSSSESSDGIYDTRVVIKATASGVYYVGVCEDGLDVDGTPTGAPVTLTARNANTYLPADSFDTADDTWAGASELIPYCAPTNVSAVAATVTNDAAVTLGAVHGSHRLDGADLYDTFAIACRAGLTYKIKANFADESDTSNNSLAAKVFTFNGTKERDMAVAYKDGYFTGSLTPVTGVYSPDDELTFVAKTNAVHYIRVWVEDAPGLDFPSYTMHATCAKSTGKTNELGEVVYADIGYVKVVSLGADGTWSVGSEKYTYPSDFTLALTNRSVSIKANAVSGFTAPAARTVEIPAWNDGDAVVTVTNKYSDIYDSQYVRYSYKKTTTKTVNGKKTTTTATVYVKSPANGDDTDAGAFILTPKNAVQTAKRTLWTDDPADWFCFNNTSSNTYYNFAIESTLGTEGDALFEIESQDGSFTLAATNEIEKILLPAGTNYVKVVHADSAAPVDSAYALKYSKATSGLVSFVYKKTTTAVKNGKKVTTTTYPAFASGKVPSYTAKESDTYATLYVTRSASEGALRVRYATQGGTAVAGSNYYPVTDGEISWAAGDKSVKTIQVRLIPELVAEWEKGASDTAGTNRTFSVRLYPADEYDLADDEYLSQIPVEEAVVTLTESTAKTPGTVALASYADGAAEETAVSNIKAPVVTGTAGNSLTLNFARNGGTDGITAVKVASQSVTVAKKTASNTAFAGTDYTAFSETLVWEDGEDDVKSVTVGLAPSANLTATKQFAFTIAAVKTNGVTAALSAKTGTVKIMNDTVAQTAAAYAKTIASSTGAKLASTGTWFNDYDGTFRSASANGTLTWTLTGPGFFLAKPRVVLGTEEGAAATLKCAVVTKNGTATTLSRTVDCTGFTDSGEVAMVLGAGTTTVKFTLSGVAKGAYVKFENTDGAPYKFVKLAGVVPANPMNKAVVFTDHSKLSWTVPEALAGVDGLFVRARFGTTSKPAAVAATNRVSTAEAAIPVPLAAGKTYYWTLDFAYGEPENLTWVAGPSVWSFSAMADNAPVLRFSGGTDAENAEVTGTTTGGVRVVLLQGVRPYGFTLDDGGEGESGGALQATNFRLVAGSLPTGLALGGTTGAITGVPTKAGTFTALLQAYNKSVKTKKKVNNKWQYTYAYTYGATLPVTFEVQPAGTSVGSFRGVVSTNESALDLNARRLGFITLTTTSAGKLTAKALVGGYTYTFSATGYSEVTDYDAEAAGTTRGLYVKLSNTVTISKKKYYNYLYLKMRDGGVTNTVALAEKAGEAELVMNTTTKSVLSDSVTYTGDIYRSNGGNAAGKEGFAPFAGYYTVSVVPEGVSASDGVPAGNGYLTLTVAESGSVKVSGVLADGTAVSASTIAQAVGADAGAATAKECALRIPFLVSKTTYAVGGVVEIAFEDPASGAALPVALPSAKLLWVKQAAKLTSADGSGFAIDLAPTGGWYDKVLNLQRYYINRGFAIEAATDAETLPAAALASGYSFTTASTPNDLEVTFAGNTLSVASRVLVKNRTTGLYDFDESVNPWNTTVKLNRATGIVTGTFYAWDWIFKSDLMNTYAAANKQTPSLAHKGVLLFSRDGSTESPLAENVAAAGFFLMPATTSTAAKTRNAAWKASLPFNIVTTSDDEKDWGEKDFSEE